MGGIVVSHFIIDLDKKKKWKKQNVAQHFPITDLTIATSFTFFSAFIQARLLLFRSFTARKKSN